MGFKRIQFLWFLLLSLWSGTLFAAGDQSLYRYPIKEDSIERLIYTAQLMGALQNFYTPALKAQGATFRWNFDWNQDFIGAGSNYMITTNEFSILLLGGQVRMTPSNFEVLATTLCHEFGHFLGGSPKQMFFPGVQDWSSSEGQSDWFASKECLPRVYEHFKILRPELLNFHNLMSTEALCLDSKEKQKCQWILGAVEKWAQVMDEVYEHKTNTPSLSKQAAEKVSETLHTKYPTIQCRLDTMKEAAFCLDRSCERPACWFKKEWNFGLDCLVNCSAP